MLSSFCREYPRFATRIARGPKDLTASTASAYHKSTVAELPHDKRGAEAGVPKWGAQRVGRDNASAARSTTEMAGASAGAGEGGEEADTFGWRSIYFDEYENGLEGAEGEDGEERREESDEADMIDHEKTTAGRTSSFKSSTAGGDGDSDERDDESPVFELQDTVIAGRWRQRKRQGRQEIYFDGTV